MIKPIFVILRRRRYRHKTKDIKEIDDSVRKILEVVGKKVYTTANYDNFNISPGLINEYSEMVTGLVEHLYINTTRYSTNAFARMEIGEALSEKKLIPHMYESREEEQKALKPEN